MTGSAPVATLTAAASRYTARRVRGKTVDQSWRERAWDFYSAVPEVRFAANWEGNAMSGATLFAGRRAEDGTIERAPDGHIAAELVASIAGGPDGQSQLLGDFGPHLTIAGEGWIVIDPVDDNMPAGEAWHVLSVQEVTRQGQKLIAEIDGVSVEIPGADPDGPIDDSAPLAIRVWEPHPRRHLEADSPVRSSLTLLEELQLLNAAVAAVARSRITGRGILLVPKGVRFPTRPGHSDSQDDLIELLMTIAETAIKDPESAAATVPIVLEVPADSISDFKLLKFDSEFDELALKLREEAIRRFATGLEIPAEILLGMGDVNHWGAWALTSEAIRLGIEPKLATVAHALTTQWLRPLLEAESIEDAGRWLVWYDTSPLRVRTTRSETAIALYGLGAISGEALRRETGFDENDAPTPEEEAQRNKQNDADVTDDEQPPSEPERLPVDETTREPDTLPAAALGTPSGEILAAAADGLIWGALTAAGEKLRRIPACPRSERARSRDVESARLHTLLPVDAGQVEQWRLLDGAWSRVPEIAGRYGLDPECMAASLDVYVRELIAAGVEHEYRIVPSVLTPCLGAAA